MAYPASWTCPKCGKVVERQEFCTKCAYNPTKPNKKQIKVPQPKVPQNKPAPKKNQPFPAPVPVANVPKSEAPHPKVRPSQPKAKPHKSPSGEKSYIPDFKAIFKVIFKPSTLEDLAGKSNIVEGLILVSIIYLISSIILFAVNTFTTGSVSSDLFGGVTVSDPFTFVVSFIKPIINYILTAGILAVLAGALGGHRDFDKTFGLMAYAQTVSFIFLFVFIVMGLLGFSAGAVGSGGDVGGMITGGMNWLIISIILLLVAFVWIVYISAKAAGIATGMSTGKAFIVLLVVGLIVNMIIPF